VCPTGSISPFTAEAKKKLFIAGIEIGLEKCLLTEIKECDRCKSVCGYDAITIIPSGNSVVMQPVAELLKCVGCGACAAICPTETIHLVPVEKNVRE
jgi:MinD superfamily P-loop ATPase